MGREEDRRSGKRVRYSWPLWFGHSDNGEFHSGQVVDLSHDVVSFSVEEMNAPRVGSHVVSRFSYPLTEDGSYGLGSYYHWSEVIRVDDSRNGRRRVAMRLHRPIAEELATYEPELSLV